MVSLIDLLSGNGGNSTANPNDPAGAYLGNMLNPATAGQFQDARNQKGDIGAAQGMLQNSGLHFPGGVTLAPGAAGLLGMMQQQAALPQQALQTAQAGDLQSQGQYRQLQGLQLLQNLKLMQQRAALAQSQYGGTGGPTQPGQGVTGTPVQDALGLIKHYESDGDYNVGYGQTDLSGAKLDSSGFPIWDGKDNSHAAGAYQFQPGTWKSVADKYFGGYLDWSKPENQDAAAAALYQEQGFRPWAPYNSNLAKAIQNLPPPQQPVMNSSVAGGQPPTVMNAISGNTPSPMAQNGGMPLPPGVTQQQVNAARLDQSLASILKGEVDPYQAQIAGFGPKIAEAGATTAAQEGAKLGTNPELVNVTVPNPSAPGATTTVQVPKNIYLGGPQAINAYLGGSASARPAPTPFNLPQVPNYSGSSLGGPSPGMGAGNMTPNVTPSAGMLLPGGVLAPRPVPMASGSPSPMMGGNGSPMASPAPMASPGASNGMIGFGKPELNPVEQANPNAVYTKMVGKGPGQDADLPVPADPLHPYTSIVPAYSNALEMPKNPDALKTIYENNGKITDQYRTQNPMLQTGIQQTLVMRDVLSSIQAGTWTQDKAALNAKMKAVGLPQIFDADPGAADIAAKENLNMTYTTLKAAGVQRITNMEVSQGMKANPSTAIQPEADAELLSNNLGTMFQQQALIRDTRLAQQNGWRNLGDFQDAWYDKNPLSGKSGFVDTARPMIGDLRGMGANQGPTGQNPAVQNYPNASARPSQATPVKTPADALKLPKGTRYVTPDGRYGTAPGSR